MIISPPEKTYRQTLTLRVAVLIVPAIAWLIALIIWIGLPKPEPISMGIAIALTALWLMMCVWVARAQLTIHAEGIRRQTAFGSTEMTWEEISETSFAQVPVAQQMGAHLGLLGWIMVSVAGKGGSSSQRTLALRSTDGRKLAISANWQDSEDAIRITLQRVNPRIKAEVRRRIQAGEAVRFGNVALSQRGVAWKNKEPIPLNTLAKCKIDGANLRIKAEGKWLDNISVSTSKVPNVFVLLELMDEMRTGGQAAPPDPLARAGG